jgi:hypothetical protein
VLTLVGRGLSNAEIAENLVLSPLTAKTHVARLFLKLGARDRAELVVMAYENGLVVPGERKDRPLVLSPYHAEAAQHLARNPA